ncbi:ABC transporter ATP-binding protein [Natronoglycomyces albus]|uniref:ABC transporter ATP-binding protein n=1 Tax=Natronoglycomyces albus TaxID=2811108 RepID=A0A895XN38_9ACTN|nr:ABC transporter ATP-binding protein [Natronoglycomyces albus]QSB04455.1 ABC transporter ATP-binding protein [Natronoglycomyces albus]
MNNHPTPTVLQATNLQKRFGNTVALGGVDLVVPRGQSLAIMGPSGSGKSTLLHALAAIQPPDEGEVRLFGERIDNRSESQRSLLRRTKFGFLFQFAGLLTELPAVDNVALPLLLAGQPRGRAIAAAREWMRWLGLTGLANNRPGEMSGGQAQRVALARALVMEPAVVFADEPTGALDHATGVETMATLHNAVCANQSTLILVTHDPEVAHTCDRIIEISDGLLTSDRLVDRSTKREGTAVA